ncbi:ectoine/hydroxyectoine ABC transporter substrate-binding protein EhuB [Arenibaculum sp.]|jgi:polar amino acid transport system substrate-binding protein|uniref:ectoine/hydroxyectoine ABC transporter substrate-binding protein EhuB n=1 Tax=Arenibaculum sp. TaxID=2865862 RepID=UPI002E0E6D4D|nr:ectoine/hydroxyectoine ABC transporter substrate-binding protein EhuB [Arenibaculum sp.]
MSNGTLGRFGAAVTGALIAAAATAGVSGAALAQDTLEQARERGYVRIAFANEAPFGYATPDGTLTGEAPEIAKVIFERMGIPEVDGVLTEWSSLIPGLKAGRFDVIAAGMFVTPKRCAEIAFSEPTYTLGQGFLVASGNPQDLHSYEDVASADDAQLGVLAGAVERDYALEAGIPDDRIVRLPDQASMIGAVRAGRVDAAALTAISIEQMARKGGDAVERAEPFTTPEAAMGSGAFGFRKEDEALREEFDKHLAEFVGSPEHLALVEEFGFTKNEMPSGVTTAELCTE